MNNKFKLGILGYNRNQVKNKFNIDENDHNETVKKMEGELAVTTREIDDLKGQIQVAENQIQIRKKEWEALEKSIFNEYIQDTKKIYDLEVDTARINEEKLKDLYAYEDESRKLKSTVNKLIKEIQFKIE